MSARWLSRSLRVLAGTAGTLVVLQVLLAAVLWWWAGTEGSLAWMLERVGRSQPLVAEGVSGSLRSGLRAQRLAWEKEGLRVEAREVQIEWLPLELFSRELEFSELKAASLQVTDLRKPSSERIAPPQSLDPGLRLTIGKLAIGKLEWKGSTPVQASQLAGGYFFDGVRHHLRIDSLALAGGRYKGVARIDALAPMLLDSRVQGTVTTAVPGSSVSLPLAFSASVRGPLQQLQAAAVVGVAAGAAVTSASPAATLTASVQPFAMQPLPQAHASLRSLDLHAFWEQAPQTRLSGELRVEPAGTATWAVDAELRNAQPGPWDSGRLPVDRLQARGQWRGGMALVQSLHAAVGGGSVQAQGRWSGASGWTAEGSLHDIDPAALHSALSATPLDGKLQVQQGEQGISFDAALKSGGRLRQTRAAPGKLPPLELRELSAQGRWQDGLLTLPRLTLRTSDGLLQGSLSARPDTRSGSGKLQLQAPGMHARLEGELAQSRGGGTLALQVADLAQAQRWLQRWPFVPSAASAWQASGQATLELAWQGGWNDPTVQAALAAPLLGLAPSRRSDAAPDWVLRNARARVDGRLRDAALELQADAEQGQRRIALDIGGRGGLANAAWAARIARLQLRAQDPSLGAGSWRVDLAAPFEARWLAGPRRLELGAGRALLTAPPLAAGAASQATLAWEPLRWGGGELQTAGQLTGLPMAWIELFGGPQLAGSALSGDLVFDARWNASVGRALRVDASLARSSGDLAVLVENAEGGSSRVAAGVREARLSLQGRDNGALVLGMQWDSERAGTAQGRLETRLVPGGPAGWQWPADAQLAGRVQAQLPRVAAWSLLAPPGWRLRGSLAADVAVSGSRSDPQLSGTVRADELALRSVVDGIELRNGWLRARLQGQQLVVEEFVLHGTGGDGTGGDGAGGSLVASGEGRWAQGGPQLQATAQLTRLRASIRSDRELTVSGQLAATVAPQGAQIRGTLAVDRARIVIPEEIAPRLGPDVIVRNAAGMATAAQRAQKKPESPPPKQTLDVSVQVDLGRDFRLSGRGIDTRLAGTLTVSGSSLTAPRLEGAIRTVGGEYRAYGQQLDIDRGILRFTGAVDNPSLDILALRPRLEQRVGVIITGQAQSPFVRLYSEPDMPDAEKLAWLIVGRASASGGAESQLLQQAAMALLANRRGGTNSGGVAGRLGLDELSVRRDDTAGAVVTLGKRFARDFYASYERSLGGAVGTLNLFYDISRRFTVRARAGERTEVDLIFTFTFD